MRSPELERALRNSEHGGLAMAEKADESTEARLHIRQSLFFEVEWSERSFSNATLAGHFQELVLTHFPQSERSLICLSTFRRLLEQPQSATGRRILHSLLWLAHPTQGSLEASEVMALLVECLYTVSSMSGFVEICSLGNLLLELHWRWRKECRCVCTPFCSETHAVDLFKSLCRAVERLTSSTLHSRNTIRAFRRLLWTLRFCLPCVPVLHAVPRPEGVSWMKACTDTNSATHTSVIPTLSWLQERVLWHNNLSVAYSCTPSWEFLAPSTLPRAMRTMLSDKPVRVDQSRERLMLPWFLLYERAPLSLFPEPEEESKKAVFSAAISRSCGLRVVHVVARNVNWNTLRKGDKEYNQRFLRHCFDDFGELISSTDQVVACMEKGWLSPATFLQDLSTLAQKCRVDLKCSAFAWLFSQVISASGRFREVLEKDVKKDARLFRWLLALQNSGGGKSAPLLPGFREHGFSVLSFVLSCLYKKLCEQKAVPDAVLSLIPLEPLEKMAQKGHHYGKMLSTSAQPVDFSPGAIRNSTHQVLTVVFASCFHPDQVTSLVLRHLASGGEHGVPLPMCMVLNLSIACRVSLASHLWKNCFVQAKSMARAGVMETLVRVLYATPCSTSNVADGMLYFLTSCTDAALLHVLVELIHCRLLRYFMHAERLSQLLTALHTLLHANANDIGCHSHPQLYWSVHALCRHAVQLCDGTAVLRFMKDKLDFGVAINRALVLTIWHSLATRHPRSRGTVPSPALLETVSEWVVTCRCSFSSAVLRVMPEELRGAVGRGCTPRRWTWDQARAAQQHTTFRRIITSKSMKHHDVCALWSGLQQELDEWTVDHTGVEADTDTKAPLLLLLLSAWAVQWCTLRQQRGYTAALQQECVARLRPVWSACPGAVQECAVFCMVDAVVDCMGRLDVELSPPSESPQSAPPHTPSPSHSPDRSDDFVNSLLADVDGGKQRPNTSSQADKRVPVLGRFLSNVALKWNLVPLGVLLDALCARDDSPHALSLLRWLLLEDLRLRYRMKLLRKKGALREHWLMDAPAVQHASYHNAFQETTPPPPNTTTLFPGQCPLPSPFACQPVLAVSVLVQVVWMVLAWVVHDGDVQPSSATHRDLLLRVIDVFHPLVQHAHAAPIRMVKLLFDSCLSPVHMEDKQLKARLMRLCVSWDLDPVSLHTSGVSSSYPSPDPFNFFPLLPPSTPAHSSPVSQQPTVTIQAAVRALVHAYYEEQPADVPVAVGSGPVDVKLLWTRVDVAQKLINCALMCAPQRSMHRPVPVPSPLSCYELPNVPSRVVCVALSLMLCPVDLQRMGRLLVEKYLVPPKSGVLKDEYNNNIQVSSIPHGIGVLCAVMPAHFQHSFLRITVQRLMGDVVPRAGMSQEWSPSFAMDAHAADVAELSLCDTGHLELSHMAFPNLKTVASRVACVLRSLWQYSRVQDSLYLLRLCDPRADNGDSLTSRAHPRGVALLLRVLCCSVAPCLAPMSEDESWREYAAGVADQLVCVPLRMLELLAGYMSDGEDPQRCTGYLKSALFTCALAREKLWQYVSEEGRVAVNEALSRLPMEWLCDVASNVGTREGL